MLLSCFSYFCFLAADLSFANQIDYRQAGLDFGSNYKNSGSLVVNSQNQVNTPGFTTDNPKQTKYYSDISNGDNGTMDNDAKNEISSTVQGDLMQNGVANRPKIVIKPNDEFLSTSQAITGNPDEVVAMLTGNYGECKPLTKTQTQTEVRTCDAYIEPDCINGSNLVGVSGGAETSWSFPYLTVDISRRGGGSCSKFFAYSNIYVKDTSKIDSFQLLSLRWDDVVQIKLNGNIVYANGNISASRCERSTDFNYSLNINLKPYLINGNNSLELALGIGGMGNATARYYLNYNKDRICQTINNCQNIPSNCNLQSTSCLNFNEQNICNYTQKLYSCSTTTTTSTAQVSCGSDIYCTNNQCSKVVDDSTNNDFATSISYLSAINQSAKDKSADNLKIFSAQANSCSNQILSYNNCCSDSGWGQSLGANCKESEIQLMKQQEKKLCHFIGSYCSKKVPLTNSCQTTSKSYCCFASKIARVINEQGRAQLNLSWGSPESPNCDGLSPTQLQSLQFNKMDLSEISNDIANNAVIPNTTNLQNQVKEKVKSYNKSDAKDSN